MLDDGTLVESVGATVDSVGSSVLDDGTLVESVGSTVESLVRLFVVGELDVDAIGGPVSVGSSVR